MPPVSPLLILAALMCLCSTLAVAESQSITSGPYNITIDLGMAKDGYNLMISISGPVHILKSIQVEKAKIKTVVWGNNSFAVGDDFLQRGFEAV